MEIEVAVHAVNEASTDDLTTCATEALHILMGFPGQPTTKSTSSVADAVALIFADAFRNHSCTDAAALADLLASSGLLSAKVKVLCDSFTDALTVASRDNVAATSALQDGFFPRATGIEWRLTHVLGDRTVDPPKTSLPNIDVTVKTTEMTSLLSDSGDLNFRCSAEQLQDMLHVMRDMVKEAERACKSQCE